jgi:hypothetical protein
MRGYANSGTFRQRRINLSICQAYACGQNAKTNLWRKKWLNGLSGATGNVDFVTRKGQK